MIISVVSQKGGVGKSSISRTLTVEFTRAGWKTLLADLDDSQVTASRWAEKRRNASGIEPFVETKVFSAAHLAVAASSEYDLVVIDGAPHATISTADAARASSLVIIPTGTSLDDIEPAILLANELANSLSSEKIVFVLYKTTSSSQEREARETISNYGYSVLDTAIPIKTGYIEAFDAGRAATETKYAQLNEAAAELVQAIAGRLKG
jgi:chromosome partitioning protein